MAIAHLATGKRKLPWSETYRSGYEGNGTCTIIQTQADIDDMQFSFMPERGTADAIFIIGQIHEKYFGKPKDLFFIFMDLEKAFDCVPRSQRPV